MQKKHILFMLGLCQLLPVPVQIIAQEPLLQESLLYETLYRPRPAMWIEPRLERPWLFTSEITLLGGSSTHARSCAGLKETLGTYLAGSPAHTHYHLRLCDLYLTLIQNLRHGFFMGLSALPLRSVSVSSLCTRTITRNHPGDSRFFIGWTNNTATIKTLDFVDCSLAFAVLAPTSNRACLTSPLPLSTGFNHHWGMSGSAWLAVGLLDWMTWGLWTDALAFFARSSAPTPGAVVTFGGFMKADHIIRSISCTMSYSYEHKNSDHAIPPSLIHQQSLHSSSRQVLNFVTEWDGQTIDHPYRPRVQLQINATITGKNIITMTTVGPEVAFDVVWRY